MKIGNIAMLVGVGLAQREAEVWEVLFLAGFCSGDRPVAEKDVVELPLLLPPHNKLLQKGDGAL